MKKHLGLWFLLTLAVFVGLSVQVGVTNEIQLQNEIAQRRQSGIVRGAWTVILPDLATIRRKQGDSLTGKLVKFDSKNLTISAGGDSETVSLAQVKSVEFPLKDEIWITLPDGTTRIARPIRGLTQSLEQVPPAAFKVESSTNRVILNLENVLSEQQFQKLTRDSKKIYVLKTIEIDAERTMTLQIRPYKPDQR